MISINDMIQFGGGSMREDEWLFMLSKCEEINAQEILEIGAGNSTLCLMKMAKKVDSFETNKRFVEYLNSVVDPNIVTLHSYIYPNFPENWNVRYDAALVDGPGQHNNNGRRDSMIFARGLSDNIFIHDFSRRNERESIEKIFLSQNWEIVTNKGRLLFLKRK